MYFKKKSFNFIKFNNILFTSKNKSLSIIYLYQKLSLPLYPYNHITRLIFSML